MFIMLRSDADGEGFGIEGTLAALTLQLLFAPDLILFNFTIVKPAEPLDE